MPTLLKDLNSGPPKPAESLPERMDGKQCTKLCLRVNLFFVGMRFIVIWELWNAQEKLKSLIRRGTLPVESIIAIVWRSIERFSNDCRKTKTKAITPTNHNRSRQRDEPITILCNYL